MPICINLRPGSGDAIHIDNGRVKITLREKTGKQAMLVFIADKSVPIEKICAADVSARSGGCLDSG
jgi:hypothetical protein